ncbi:hypothetical protein PF004_g29372 [Phytophthora fragariae]|uniref:Uncharacterized protein n=1 Tax=Phytophthora fragariae TaxID=53985 RepID=A0A6G0MFQ0_9STRA|nr:hypothetical protein PF004_g29372 [Phytophthora fragariae]
MAKEPRTRSGKAALRTIRKLATPGCGDKPAKRRRLERTTPSLEDIEASEARARISCFEETQARNTVGQNVPCSRKLSLRGHVPESDLLAHESDKSSFFETIDELFLRVCGSCGELTKSARAIRKCYDLTQKYFAPLKNRSAVAMLLF